MHHIHMKPHTHARANTLATGNWVPFHNCCWYSILSTNSWPAFSIAILSVAYSTTFHSPSSLSLSLVLLSFYLPLYLCLVVLRIVNYCYAVSFCLRFDPIWIFFCYYVCCSLFFSFSLCYSWWHDISCFFYAFFRLYLAFHWIIVLSYFRLFSMCYKCSNEMLLARFVFQCT